uniref:Uncharacterized protein n=1 Tax=Siphoviridae sp. ctJ0s2 TaxID=2827834 RepID=A0A8S5TFL0_9CAUD|nr:MAG TPA: hypothetical protein [Siphoviridae sp. ctJ0s2]
MLMVHHRILFAIFRIQSYPFRYKYFTLVKLLVAISCS